MKLEEQIVVYMSNYGISPIEEWDPLKEHVAASAPSHLKSLILDNKHEYEGRRFEEMACLFDLWQSDSVLYEIRLGFLESMVHFLGSLGGSDLIVTDAGMATGLDICFLASHFPKIEFTGYDRFSDSVDIAIQRAADLGLSNTHFYVEDHNNPIFIDIGLSDVVYAKMAAGVKMLNDPLRAINLGHIGMKVSHGGHLIDAATPDAYPEYRYLDGFELVNTLAVAYISQYGSTAYNHVFKKES